MVILIITSFFMLFWVRPLWYPFSLSLIIFISLIGTTTLDTNSDFFNVLVVAQFVFMVVCLKAMFDLWKKKSLAPILLGDQETGSVISVYGVMFWSDNGDIKYAGDLSRLPPNRVFILDKIQFTAKKERIVIISDR